MEDIAIFGAGGFGHETALLIEHINSISPKYNILGFFDDKEIPSPIMGKYQYLGDTNSLNNYKKEINIALALGNPNIIEVVRKKLTGSSIKFPNLIHSTVIMYEGYYSLGEGNIFCAYTAISCDVNIGSFNVFNSHTTLGHDVTVGSYNVFNPRTQISGNVSIGNNNMLGLNSAIIQSKKLGNGNTLAPGSILYTSKKDNKWLLGNPAKEIKF